MEPSVNTTTKIPNRVVTGEQSELLGPVEQKSVNADKRVEQVSKNFDDVNIFVNVVDEREVSFLVGLIRSVKEEEFYF